MENLPEIYFQNPKENYISKNLNPVSGLEILKSLVDFAKRHKVKVSELSIPAIAKAFRLLTDGTVSDLPVEALRKIYEGFRSNLDNIVALTAYSPKYLATWKEILQSTTISADSIKDTYGTDVKIVKLKAKWETLVVTEALFFPLLAQSKYQSFYGMFVDLSKIKTLILEPEVRRYLASKILGEESVMPRFLDELPSEQTLNIANFEHAISGSELFNLQGIAMGGDILKQTGLVLHSRLKKIVTSNSVNPFGFGNPLLNRAEIVSMIYFSRLTPGETSLSIKQLTRFLVEEFPGRIFGTQIAAFLPHLYGFTKALAELANFRDLTSMVNALVKEADDEWLDLTNFKMLLLCSQLKGIHTQATLSVFPDQWIERNLIREADRNKPYNPRNKFAPVIPIDEVGMPLALNWLQTLCGFGLLDIAFDPDAPGNDPLNGMRYCRLTPLGRFAFGMTANYTPQAERLKSEIDYDAENGILTDYTPNSPYSLLFGKISTPIGSNRYLISPRSIARDCKTPREADERLGMIQQIVSPETAKAMTPVFIEAQKRLTCGQIDSGFDVITIRPELDELRTLLTTNPDLTKIVTKLGRNVFLIKHSDIFKLNAHLALEGFRL